MKFGFVSIGSAGRRAKRIVAGVGFVVAAAYAVAWSEGLRAQGRDFEIRTISTRPDTVSGGDVLVRVNIPSNVTSDQVSITLNGQEVTTEFRTRQETNALFGVVRRLAVGRNQVRVGLRRQRHIVELTLINHPITGPVMSGPHQAPFYCETEVFGLGPALDANCSAKTRADYFYRSNLSAAAPDGSISPESPTPGVSTVPSQFKPFDPAGPRPTDLAYTTTSEGGTVPYIVRREMGTINRAVYVIAFLHEPGQPLPDPWTSAPGWNRRLIYAFGGGCGQGHRQGGQLRGLTEPDHLEPPELGDYPLAKGYAVASSSLNVFDTSCSDLISAETMMMVKEHFIEQFGEPLYTIGSGRSGGAMQQYSIANNYPGLLDGITPTASFADSMTFLTPLHDCELLDRAFSTSPFTWTVEQKTAVAGFSIYEYCTRNKRTFQSLDPVSRRVFTPYDETIIPVGTVYHPTANPKGIRFTYQDNLVNVFGRDRKTGFARRPWDNVGIQYGLGAFNAGKISFEQFLDLNRRIGGHDIDGNVSAIRTVADPDALRIAHQTGRLNDASRGLSTVPIIDVRPYTDGTPDVHDIVASHITRARLVAANGNAGNQVLLTYASGTQIRLVQRDVLDKMDEWLSNIVRDTVAASSRLEKVVRNKPSGLVDACYTATLDEIKDPVRCREFFPVASNPRLVAGMPLSHDRLKCELKPVDRSGYTQPLSESQLASLREVFPQGVCDYDRRGVGQRPSQTWLSYPGAGESRPLE